MMIVCYVYKPIERYCSPRESEGVCFYRRWFMYLSVCL